MIVAVSRTQKILLAAAVVGIFATLTVRVVRRLARERVARLSRSRD